MFEVCKLIIFGGKQILLIEEFSKSIIYFCARGSLWRYFKNSTL